MVILVIEKLKENLVIVFEKRVDICKIHKDLKVEMKTLQGLDEKVDVVNVFI